LRSFSSPFVPLDRTSRTAGASGSVHLDCKEIDEMAHSGQEAAA
jgi:hypothetical protein